MNQHTPRRQVEFNVRTVRQLLDWSPPHVDYIIDQGILWPRTRLVIYGLKKSWKSIVTMNMGFDLAQGVPTLGGSKTRAGGCSVLIVQIEIPEAMLRKRVQKYALAHNRFPNNLRFGSTTFLKLDTPYGRDRLEAEIKRHHPDVLIIDPIYRVISGNISESVQMGHFLDNMDYLMDVYGFALVLVHHERKTHFTDDGEEINAGSQEMIGSSYLLNWYDAAVNVHLIGPSGSNRIQLNFVDMRHAEEELPSRRILIPRDSLGMSLLEGTDLG